LIIFDGWISHMNIPFSSVLITRVAHHHQSVPFHSLRIERKSHKACSCGGQTGRNSAQLCRHRQGDRRLGLYPTRAHWGDIGELCPSGRMVWRLLSPKTWLVCAAQGPGLFLPPFLLEAFGSGRDFERKCPAWASEGLTILCLQLVVARGSFEKLVWEFA